MQFSFSVPKVFLAFVIVLFVSPVNKVVAETLPVKNDSTLDETQMQILLELERLATDKTVLSSTKLSILQMIRREREQERLACLNRWNNSSFAKVWERSPWGGKDGRTWEDLTYEERQYFRQLCIDKYIEKKFPELDLPKLKISENEYSRAWEILQTHDFKAPRWSKIMDTKMKSQFRKEYHDYKLSLVSGSHYPPRPASMQEPVFASILRLSNKKV